ASGTWAGNNLPQGSVITVVSSVSGLSQDYQIHTLSGATAKALLVPQPAVLPASHATGTATITKVGTYAQARQRFQAAMDPTYVGSLPTTGTVYAYYQWAR